jgi:GH15 family glucan-1,4-alpha-glucosidase
LNTRGLPKIQDYAIIGDGRSAALISNRGSIDWLCWPRFDSPSIFGAIVDPKNGGHWSVRPAHDSKVTRRYLDKTNVLETTFARDSAKIVLTDFMSVTSEETKRKHLWPEHEIIRQVKCEGGDAEIIFEFNPRLNYGRVVPKIDNVGKLGWRFGLGTHVYTLRGDVDLDFKESGEAPQTVANLRLKSGDAIAFSFTFSEEGPAVLPPLGDDAHERLKLTADWWRDWISHSNYRGKYERHVTRSALALKLMSYAPSGAIVAAPTTSLPERLGSYMNWDYRFAWLRDAAFTVHTLFGLGYKEDAEAFVNWLLHATNLTRPELRVTYDVFGERPIRERELEHFAGYRGSRPVRIGNAASEQTQLDIYGEVVEAVCHFFGTETPDHEMQKMLRQCGEFVCEHWNEPDNGMWEERDKLRHYTHSRLMCWVALDRLIEMHECKRISGFSIEKFKEARAAIRREIEQHAWNDKLGAYTQAVDNEVIDASTLLLAYHRFEDACSERMQATHRQVRERLIPRVGLVHRNEQSRDRGEGAFALCSFFETDFLARSGRLDEAHEVYEGLLSFANDVDLFAEEIDPETGDALGNFPQAFTHLGVIHAALTLRDIEEGTHKLQRTT